MQTPVSAGRLTELSEDELLSYVLDLPIEEVKARRDAEEFFAAIGAQDPDSLPEMDESLRRIHENSMQLLRQLDLDREGFENDVDAFYRRCAADPALARSTEFSHQGEAELLERCEHTLTGISRILEDRLPMSLRRKREAVLRIDWSKKGFLAFWDEFREKTGVPLVSAARHAAEHEGGFEDCSSQLAARIAEEIKTGVLDLPGFVRREMEDEETALVWTPPNVAVTELQATSKLPLSEAPDDELDGSELHLMEAAPVLAWLRDTIQTRLSLAEAASGGLRPNQPAKIITVPMMQAPRVDRGLMRERATALVACLERSQRVTRDRIVRELGRDSMLRLRLSMCEGDVEATERSMAAADVLFEMCDEAELDVTGSRRRTTGQLSSPT